MDKLIDYKDVAVVIPTHKQEMNELEKISYDRVKNVLKNYDIYFVLPQNIHMNDMDINEKHFDSSNFAGEVSYNNFLMETELYETFIDYKYILIVQLDVFIFSDRLLEFANMGWDYIGAPWLSGIEDGDNSVVYVGNGGLSLRNTEACIKAINDNIELRNTFYGKHEDAFFAICKNLKIPPLEIALDFAFETQIKRCFELNNNKLPFGCHAWEKYDLPTLKPYIESYGYIIKDEWLRLGTEDRIYVYIDESRKFKSYFNVMITWINCINQGKSLMRYLENRGIKNIALYGYNDLTKLLINESCGEISEIHIKCIIDKNAENIFSAYPSIRPDKFDLDMIDMIIVTAFHYYEEIKYQMRNLTNVPIVSLKDILDELNYS